MSAPLPNVLVTVSSLPTAEALARLVGLSCASDEEVPDSPWNLAPLSIARSWVHELDREEVGIRLALRHVTVLVGCASKDGPQPTARFIDAISRAAPLHDWRDRPVLRLDALHAQLLHALANGSSVAEAAKASFLSERSAHRSLQQSRSTLGVPTTAAAVACLHDHLSEWREPER